MQAITEEVQRLVQEAGDPPTQLQIPPNLTTPDRTVRTYAPSPAACPTCGANPGEPGYLMADVPLSHQDFGKLTPCPTCHAKKLLDQARGLSQIEGDLQKHRFSTFKTSDDNRAGYEVARKFAQRPTGWLTLWGTYGVGKTHLLAAIANELIQAGTAAIYHTLPDLMDKLRSSYKDDFDGTFHRLANIPVLLVDEVDKINPTQWAMEKALQLFEARYRLQGQLGTAFAMNNQPEVSDTEMDYLFSRMYDRRFAVIEVAGGDVRPVEVDQ